MSGKLRFSVESWSAWSSSIGSRAAWIDWANQCQTKCSESEPIDVSKIPAMKRRRMSRLTKMALVTALDCVSDKTEDFTCVFASKNGELTRTVKIIDDIVSQQDLSPTDFSLSVHNTASGLFSIQTVNKKPITSVAAGDDSFSYGMLEACIALSRFPNSSVLLVYFDEPLPDVLSKYEESPNEAVCVALMLKNFESDEQQSVAQSSANKRNGFEFSVSSTGMKEKNKKNPGRIFLKFLLSSAENAQYQSVDKCWSWRRLCLAN